MERPRRVVLMRAGKTELSEYPVRIRADAGPDGLVDLRLVEVVFRDHRDRQLGGLPAGVAA